ncbi:MAG TPA: nucleotidyltransferase family protein [Anaerolineales bacterium]|nr:nucleotidyltransferase family protein [Anaerolineales bacterium]
MIGIVLAAGGSTRMAEIGQIKPVLDWFGKPMLEHVLQQAKASQLNAVWVVVGCCTQQTTLVAQAAGADKILQNPDWLSGLASSIQLAVRHALETDNDALAFILADCPLLEPAHIDAAIACSQNAPNRIVRAHHAGLYGHPVIFPRAYWQDLLEIPGNDSGGRFIFQKYADFIVSVNLPSTAIFDIDTPSDYAMAKQAYLSGEESLDLSHKTEVIV